MLNLSAHMGIYLTVFKVWKTKVVIFIIPFQKLDTIQGKSTERTVSVMIKALLFFNP